MNFDSAPNPLALPDDIYLGEVGGVATNSRGDIFVYTRTGHPTVSMATARPVRARRIAAVSVRSQREIHARNRPGTLRVSVRRAGSRRSPGQRLGRRRDVGHGHEIRSAGRASRFSSGARRKRFRIRRARAGRAGAAKAEAAAVVVLPGQERSRTSSTVRPTSRGTRKATSSSPTAAATRASPSSRRTACS